MPPFCDCLTPYNTSQHTHTALFIAAAIMAGVGSAVKEAEVLSAFHEINEDLQGKTEVVEKCECWGGGGQGEGKGRGAGLGGRKEIVNTCWVRRVSNATCASNCPRCRKRLLACLLSCFLLPALPPTCLRRGEGEITIGEGLYV